jgi:hypothetical protein
MIRNTWICGMVENGIELTSNAGAVTFRGTASVRNQRGVLMNQMSGVVAPADFGIGAQAGGNVFTKNTLVVGNAFLNFRVAGGATTSTQVQGNQWEHCGNGQTCNINQAGGILEKDVAGNVTITAAQAHRNPGSITIDPTGGVYPTKVAAPGDLVHIHGSGFNAIEGYEPGSVSCNNLGNSCFSLQGTCVEFKDASGLFQPAEVVAITPTYIAVRAPFACSRPGAIRIRRRNHLGATVELDVPAAFCRN